MRTLSVRVASKIVTGETTLSATKRIRLQSAVRAKVLIVAAPASILKAPSINFMCDLTTHVGKIGPTIATSVASFHFLKS